MEKVLGVEFLPLEVLEVIVTFLSAKDLSHCVGVSRAWYNIFSSDIFWKRHCITNSSQYFSKTKNIIDPVFNLAINDTIAPLEEHRLQFLQEQQLLKNWNHGRYWKEEIVFDCDDTIGYNIKVSFLDNEHLCLHLTYETQVWNVVDTPVMVLSIPYSVNELWEANVYKIVDGDLVVIQYTVVQIFKINLNSKSWSRTHVFFFDKPEEFSCSLNGESNVNDILNPDLPEEMYEKVICGGYMVGVTVLENYPLLHIWDIKTGKKIKEDKCDIMGVSYISLNCAKDVTNRVLITFELKNVANQEEGVLRWSSIIYDLSKCQFLMQSRIHHNGNVLYFDGNLAVIDDIPLKIVFHGVTLKKKGTTSNESTQCLPEFLESVTSVQPIGSDLLISSRREIFVIKTSRLTAESQHVETSKLLDADFDIDHIQVLFDRYVLIHKINYESMKEIWKYKPCTKILEFSEDFGKYAASNDVCTKVVLEKANKLILLNFW